MMNFSYGRFQYLPLFLNRVYNPYFWTGFNTWPLFLKRVLNPCSYFLNMFIPCFFLSSSTPAICFNRFRSLLLLLLPYLATPGLVSNIFSFNTRQSACITQMTNLEEETIWKRFCFLSNFAKHPRGFSPYQKNTKSFQKFRIPVPCLLTLNASRGNHNFHLYLRSSKNTINFENKELYTQFILNVQKFDWLFFGRIWKTAARYLNSDCVTL